MKTLLSVLLLFVTLQAFSQKKNSVSSNDFKALVGQWKGSLTYLDYSSNKPFSMPAEIKVENFEKTNAIRYFISYPEEPKANEYDTLFISENGTMLNGEKITSKKIDNEKGLIIITESKGVDGNDDKPALFRHTYTISSKNYAMKKEVQFVGEKEWLLRNSYSFSK